MTAACARIGSELMSRPTEPSICANALTNSSLSRFSLVNQSGMMDPNWASISMPFTQPEMSSWTVIASNQLSVSAFAASAESYRKSPCTRSRWSSGSMRRAEVMARAAFGMAITSMPSMGSHAIPPASRSLQSFCRRSGFQMKCTPWLRSVGSMMMPPSNIKLMAYMDTPTFGLYAS